MFVERKNNEFGKELRSLRTDPTRKYSQEQLAKLVGVTASHISQLESGNRKPKPSLVRSLSYRLGVKPNHLFAKLGRIEMDLAGTFATHKDELKYKIPSLTDEELYELANYLTYLDFKSSILD